MQKHKAFPFIKTILSLRMFVALAMGFSCGLPLLLTIGLLQAWMKESGADLAAIGLIALVGLPYTLKFLWAPVFDFYSLPFLGRRRGWLLVIQLTLVLAIISMGLADPVKTPVLLVISAIAVTFFSASQDVIIDAYRREDLSDKELGLGSAFYINGYRLGMLLASGGGMIMADHMSFNTVYLIMAVCMTPGIITTIMCKEPDTVHRKSTNFYNAVLDPLKDYFTRKGAIHIILFILLYKVGDTMASFMTTPFYLDIGFTKTEIGAVVKLFGLWAIVAGTIVGGTLMLRIGIIKALFIFGFLQAASTACFAALSFTGPSLCVLACVIAFENFSGGMGTSAYTAYMASITNKRFTATQYALLSGLMGIPRVITSAPTGFMVEFTGWPAFFLLCSVIAIPGIILIKYIEGFQN